MTDLGTSLDPGSQARPFAGFAALPAPAGMKPKRPWWIVLNYGDSDEARADLSIDALPW